MGAAGRYAGRDRSRPGESVVTVLDDVITYLEMLERPVGRRVPAPIEKLAILRLDGDMYESTIQPLDSLYHKVSPGGFIIVDDYTLPGCRKAVDDFRERNGIANIVEDIDGIAAFWRKT